MLQKKKMNDSYRKFSLWDGYWDNHFSERPFPPSSKILEKRRDPFFPKQVLKEEEEERKKRLKEEIKSAFHIIPIDCTPPLVTDDLKSHTTKKEKTMEPETKKTLSNIKNTFSQTLTQSLKLAIAKSLNEQCSKIVSELAHKAGIPKFVLEDKKVELFVEFLTPCLLRTLCEIFPDKIPANHLIKEGSEMALIMSSTKIVLPLLKSLRPHFTTLSSEAQKVIDAEVITQKESEILTEPQSA